MTRPLIVDLCCCAGGASRGYVDAGFDVVGIDIDPQPNYPYPFMQADALSWLGCLAAGDQFRFGDRWIGRDDVDAFHASFPCQAHSALTKGNRSRGWVDDHVDLIAAGRELFDMIGLPYVLENVAGSPLRRDLTVCGLKHFGLRVFRHRYFELGGWSMPPLGCNGRSDHAGHRVAGWRHGVKYEGDMLAIYGDGGGKGSIADWEAALGIDWVRIGDPKERRRTLAEAIPPVYTRFVGAHLLRHLRAEVAA